MQQGLEGGRKLGRRWRFGDAVFDEGKWLLLVGGRRQVIETKPLEVLRELLLGAGEVVTKEQLLETVWPNVHVVEGSIPTAIGKLRKVLRDELPEHPIIETVPRKGYRIASPVTLETVEIAAARPQLPPRRRFRRRALWGGALIAAGVALTASVVGLRPPVAPARPVYSRHQVTDALRRLDQHQIETMVSNGWNPGAPLDNLGDDALKVLLNVCEWDPGHDRRALLLVARTLIDGGARLDTRNYWGDTAYSIAKAPRYCGPRHPVTVMLRTMCYNGYKPAGDGCLADYAHSAAARNGGRLP